MKKLYVLVIASLLFLTACNIMVNDGGRNPGENNRPGGSTGNNGESAPGERIRIRGQEEIDKLREFVYERSAEEFYSHLQEKTRLSFGIYIVVYPCVLSQFESRGDAVEFLNMFDSLVIPDLPGELYFIQASMEHHWAAMTFVIDEGIDGRGEFFRVTLFTCENANERELISLSERGVMNESNSLFSNHSENVEVFAQNSYSDITDSFLVVYNGNPVWISYTNHIVENAREVFDMAELMSGVTMTTMGEMQAARR